MIGIARLDDAMHCNRADIVLGKSAVMGDVDDAGAFLGNKTSKARQSAGAITDCSGEAAQPAIGCQAAFNYPAEHVQINISAAQWQYYFLALKVRRHSGKTGSQRSGACAFDNCLLQLHQPQNC